MTNLDTVLELSLLEGQLEGTTPFRLVEYVLFRVLISVTSHQWIRSWIVSLIGFEQAMLRFIDSQSHSLLYFAFLCIENREYCYYVRTVVIYDLTISKVFVYDPLLWFHCICQALCWFSRIIRMAPMQEMENFFSKIHMG